MTKKEVLMQRGLQVQQFASAKSSTKSQSRKEIERYMELCPPGTDENRIERIIKETKGDQIKIQNAISELWEDHRGGEPDEWATVQNKRTKKKLAVPREDFNSSRGRGRGGPGRGGGRGGRGRGRGQSAPAGGRGSGRSRRDENKTANTTSNDHSGSVEPQNRKPTEREGAWAEKSENTTTVETPSTNAWTSQKSAVVNGSANVAWGESPKNSGWGDESLQQKNNGWGDASTKEKKVVQKDEPKANAWTSGSPLIKTTTTSEVPRIQESPTTQPRRQQKAFRSQQPGSLSLNESGSTSTNGNLDFMGNVSPVAAAIPPQESSSNSSPKQYLKMGKWDSPAVTELPLQFGSFSLETTSDANSTTSIKDPAAWSSSWTTSGNRETTTNSTTAFSPSHYGTRSNSSTTSNSSTPSRPVRDQTKQKSAAYQMAPPGMAPKTENESPQPTRESQKQSPPSNVRRYPYQQPDHASGYGADYNLGLAQSQYGYGMGMPTPPIPTTTVSTSSTTMNQDKTTNAKSNAVHVQQQPTPPVYHPQQYGAPPPPPGMTVPYNPYNYGNYYQQNYGYYQNPQYPNYSRQQYPPRGNVPYDNSFPNPNMPVGYPDQGHPQYPPGMPQGFGELGGYLHPGQAPPSTQRKGAEGKHQTAAASTSSSTTTTPSTTMYATHGYDTTGTATSVSSTSVAASNMPTGSMYGQQPPSWGGAGAASYGQQPGSGNWQHGGMPYHQQPQQQRPTGGAPNQNSSSMSSGRGGWKS